MLGQSRDEIQSYNQTDEIGAGSQGYGKIHRDTVVSQNGEAASPLGPVTGQTIEERQKAEEEQRSFDEKDKISVEEPLPVQSV